MKTLKEGTEKVNKLFQKLASLDIETQESQYQKTLDDFFIELENSRLSLTEKFKLLMCKFKFKTLSSETARHGATTTVSRLIGLIKLMLKSGVDRNDIAKLMSRKDLNGESFTLIVATYQNSTNFLHCLAIIQQLVDGGIERKQLWNAGTSTFGTVLTRRLEWDKSKPETAALYQLANSRLLLDSECKYLGRSYQKRIWNYIFTLSNEEKDNALGCCLDNQTSLGKVMHTQNGDTNPSYKSGYVREAFIALFNRDPDSVSESEFESLMTPIREKNKKASSAIANNSTSSSSQILSQLAQIQAPVTGQIASTATSSTSNNNTGNSALLSKLPAAAQEDEVDYLTASKDGLEDNIQVDEALLAEEIAEKGPA
jgi:hypothetical protein